MGNQKRRRSEEPSSSEQIPSIGPPTSAKRLRVGGYLNCVGPPESLVLFSSSQSSRSTEVPATRALSLFRRLIVFGDSYSSGTQSSWVGYFAEPLPDLSVENYARPGASAEDDLGTQVARYISHYEHTHSVDRSQQSASEEANSSTTITTQESDVLYVLWIGINDCGATDEDELESIVEEKVGDAIHDLYVKASARHFLLINVPPMQRTPAGEYSAMIKTRCEVWNEHLLRQAKVFAEEAKKHSSIVVISAHRMLSDILDDPEKYGLVLNDDSDTSGDSESDDDPDAINSTLNKIWADEQHLTTHVHKILGASITGALEALSRKS